MIYDSSFCVRAFRKDNCQPADKGYTLSTLEIGQLQEASEKLHITRNDKSLSYELLKLLTGETSFFVWGEEHDVYLSACRAYDDTKALRTRFQLKTLCYFDEIECIEKPVFLVFSRMEIDE